MNQEELDTILGSLHGITLGMQVPVVVGLTLLSLNLRKILEKEVFGFLSIAWAFNLVYVLIELFIFHYDVINSTNISNSSLRYFLVIIADGFVMYYILRSTNPYIQRVSDGRFVRFKFMALVSTIAVYTGALFLVMSGHKIIIISVYDFLILLLHFFHTRTIKINKSENFQVYSVGVLLFSFTQLLYISDISSTYGFILGFISKVLMLIGLYKVMLYHAKEQIDRETLITELDDLFKSTFHEIAKPINHISKDLQFLRGKKKYTTNVEGKLNSLNSAFNRLSAIYNSAIELFEESTSEELDKGIYYKGINHNVLLEPEILKLNYIVEKAIRSVQTYYIDSDITFNQHYSGNANVLFEPYSLTEVITNILNNAIECFEGKSGNIFIETRNIINREEGQDDFVVLEIANDGPAICSSIKENIFEKGVTTKSGGGHGFGLHHVKQNLESGNALIFLESPVSDYKYGIESGGTIFTIRFIRT